MELSIVLRTTEIDDQGAEEFVALVARYGMDVELPASMRNGRAVPRKKRAGPESAILTEEALSKGFSFSVRPVFLSPLDERGFNDWLKAIHPRYAGLNESKTAVLDLKSAEVDVATVWDLLAICRCYSLNLARLRRLCEVADREYFDDKKWRWHKQVFGTPQSS